MLGDVFEHFVEKSTLMYGINPLYSYSAPGYTWKAGLKLTNVNLDYIREKDLLFLLENFIHGGISSIMGDRLVQSDEKKQIFYIVANNLNGWAMSQYLPTGNFEKLQLPENYSQDQVVEETIQIPDNNEYGYFIESDLEYPVEKKKQKFSIVPSSNKSRSRLILRLYE